MASNLDGSVIIGVDMNVSQAEKRLAKLSGDIRKAEKSIEDMSRAKASAQEKSLFHGAELDEEKAKLQEIRDRLEEIRNRAKDKGLSVDARESAKAMLPSIQLELKEQQARVSALQTQWNAAENAVDRYNNKIESSKQNLEQTRTEAGILTQSIEEENQRIAAIREGAVVSDQHIVDLNAELVQLKARQAELQQTGIGLGYEEYDKISARIQEINQEIRAYQNGLLEAGEITDNTSAATSRLAGKIASIGDTISGTLNRIKGLTARVFFFSVITSALRSIRSTMSSYIKANDETRQAIAELKAAFLTLAQPIFEVVIPALTAVINVLAKIVTAAAQLVSMLFGKTLQQSRDSAKALYEEANAIDAVGKASDEAAGSLAGFDEINRLNTESEKSSDGMGGNGDKITPDFGFADKYKDIIEELMVYLSGALLVIGAILVFSGANIPLGLGLMVLGAAVLAQEIKENWGAVDGEVRNAVNRMLIILGSALLVIGAILAFSGANIPLGIGLMALGAAMLATVVALNWGDINDNLRSALTAALLIVGAFLIVLGAILTFSGANIPLGIALMVLGATALAAAVAVNWDSMSQELQAALTALMLIVGGALLVIGVILVLSGANVPLGLGLMVLGAVVLAAAVAINWGSMSEELRAALTVLMLIIGSFLLVIGAILAFSGANVQIGIAIMLLGAAALATAAALNWDLMGVELKRSLSAIMLIVGEFLLVLGLLLTFSGANVPLGIGLIILGVVALAAAAALDWDNVKNKIQGILSEILMAVGAALLVLGSLLTFSGTNIPLGIALLAAGALSLASGAALNWDQVKNQITEIITALAGILCVAFLVLGAILTFSGSNIPLGIALLVLGITGVGYAKLNWNAIEQALQGPIGRVAAIASAALLVLGVIIAFSGVGLPLGIALIAAGAAGLVTVTALNWNALKEKLGETWDGIKSWWNQSVSKYLTLDYWKGIGKDIIDGFLSGLKKAWETVTSWAASVVDWLTGLFDGAKKSANGIKNASIQAGPSSSSRPRAATKAIPDLSTFDIPMLAQGAVIPPNREFMAVLGDQRSGNNLEAPEGLLRQIYREENSSVTQILREILDAVKEGKIIMVDRRVLGRVVTQEQNRLTRASGNSVVLT